MCLLSTNANEKYGSLPPLSEEESLKSFIIKDGYKMNLAAGDQFLDEPVHIAWDGNGALYVAQMENYMNDADMTGEKDPMYSFKTR